MLKKGVSKGVRFDGDCNYCQKPGHKARFNGKDVCRVLMADRKAGKTITFPREGLKPKPKAKAKAKAGKGARKGVSRSAALLDGEDGEEEEQDEEVDDQECGMFQEDDEGCFALQCESDDEDIGHSLCTLDFSYYGQPPLSTSRYDPPAAVATQHNAVMYESDVEREMKAYVDSNMIEGNDEAS